MVKTKFKKAVSLMLAAVMSLTAFMGIGATTAFAAVGEKADVYLVDYPRSGDTNNNGEWGHGNLNYMNGWRGLSTKYTGLRAMGSYSGNIAYCIEPGTGQRTGDTLTEKDENFFSNISPNGTISGDDIRLLIGRILQYGYRGGISTSWKSQNESDANCIAHAYATQILIWETIVGERDAGFNHVSTGGYNAVLECVSSAHPLRSKILSYYNSMVTSVQNHTKVPSFCTRSSGSAKVNELEWNGSKYVATLTDTNGVLGNYTFSANIDGVSFSTSGNKLTVSMEKAPSKEFTITAAKKNGVRRGVVVWSDGIHQNGNGIQDVVTYAQEVSDPVSGFVKMKVSYGSCQIVKTSEDGKVDGIQFTVSGNGVNQTVTTANGGKFQLDNLMPYGLKGTVKFVDDAGQIHMKWENGSSLALNIHEDTFEKVEAPEKISVILVEPGRYPKLIEIEDTLEAMQSLVEGDIEEYMPFEDEVAIICNDEGKMNGLPLNRAVYSEPEYVEMSYPQLKAHFRQAEKERNHTTGYIVFTADSFDKPYTEEQRTYVVSSNNKAFIEGMGGYSIYASSLDGSDKCVRLEAYMADEHGGKDGWKIEKCYVKDDSNREMLDIIAGKFFIAYAPIESEKFLSMPKELARKYEEKFKYPERFYKSLDGIEAKPYKPVSKDMER